MKDSIIVEFEKTNTVSFCL